jgi:hypothetical protein
MHAKFEDTQTREILDRQKHYDIVKYTGLECLSPLQNPHPVLHHYRYQGHDKEKFSQF